MKVSEEHRKHGRSPCYVHSMLHRPQAIQLDLAARSLAELVPPSIGGGGTPEAGGSSPCPALWASSAAILALLLLRLTCPWYLLWPFHLVLRRLKGLGNQGAGPAALCSGSP